MFKGDAVASLGSTGNGPLADKVFGLSFKGIKGPADFMKVLESNLTMGEISNPDLINFMKSALQVMGATLK
jgi:hypothetical protein